MTANILSAASLPRLGDAGKDQAGFFTPAGIPITFRELLGTHDWIVS